MLRHHMPVLHRALRRLQQLPDRLPETFVHGDGREDNIYRRVDGSGGIGFSHWDYSLHRESVMKM